MNRRIIVVALCLVVFFILFLTLNIFFYTRSDKIVVIGSKCCTENHILAEILAILIENKTDLKVKRKFSMEGTFVCFESLKNGDIDIYPEYIATAMRSILKQKSTGCSVKNYEIVKKIFKEKYSILWMDPLGFSNSYVLTISSKKGNRLGIDSISDLRELLQKDTDFKIAFDHEFYVREELCDLERLYRYLFRKRSFVMDQPLLYLAIAHGAVDVISAYQTDGNIINFDLKILRDDKVAFSSYDAAFLVRQDKAEKFSRLTEVIKLLNNRISIEKMRRMNYGVDVERKKIFIIAREFLIAEGLISG